MKLQRSKTAGRGKWKAGFDLKTLISISNYLSSFYGDIEGITYFSLWSQRVHFDGGGTNFYTPDHDSGTSLATLISHPSTEGIFTSSRMSVEEKKISFGTVLL